VYNRRDSAEAELAKQNNSNTHKHFFKNFLSMIFSPFGILKDA